MHWGLMQARKGHQCPLGQHPHSRRKNEGQNGEVAPSKPRPPDSWPGALSPPVLSYARPPPRRESGSSGLLASWQGLVLQWPGQPHLGKVFYAALSF